MTQNPGNNIDKKTSKSSIRENIEAILIAILLALFIRTFAVQAFKIPSGSMKQTLLIGDHILVNKFIYGITIPFSQYTLLPVGSPQRGDIIVFKYPKDPSKDYIKRVVGIGSDRIEIRDKTVFVNEEAIALPQTGVFSDPNVMPAGFQPRDNFGPVTVPDGSLFVMGDNRDESSDSRYWGFADVQAVKGKAFMIYWSWDHERSRIRWGRIANLIR